MNRWTGIGRVTKAPKRNVQSRRPNCSLRIAVKCAGRDGRDGHFDIVCFDDQAVASTDYVKVGREVAIDGRLMFEEFQTENGSYTSRVYIVAERVEFLRGAPSTGLG